MDFKIVSNGEHNEVIAVPSDPEGLFLLQHGYYGRVALTELELSAIPGEARRAVDAGDAEKVGEVLRKHIYNPYDASRDWVFADMVVTANIPVLGGHASHQVRSVTELAPVIPAGSRSYKPAQVA